MHRVAWLQRGRAPVAWVTQCEVLFRQSSVSFQRERTYIFELRLLVLSTIDFDLTVKMALELESLERNDRSAAMAKLDDIDACLDEPRGSFYKVSKRLFDDVKAQSLT